MYLNTTVKIPVMKGKIITKKKGGATYIRGAPKDNCGQDVL